MSKELDAFNSLMKSYYDMCLDLGNNDMEYQKWNTTSERTIIEKALKALEIIKRNKVDIKDLIGEFEWSDGLTSYNERINHIPLSQEEYNLLKEILQ